MMPQPVQSVPEAIVCLRALGVDVSMNGPGWVLSLVDANGNYLERSCASDAELIGCARAQQQRPLFERNRGRLELLLDVFRESSYSTEQLGGQGCLTDWPSCRRETTHKEVGT